MRKLDSAFNREISEFAISCLTRKTDLTIDVRVAEIIKSSLFIFALTVTSDIYNQFFFFEEDSNFFVHDDHDNLLKLNELVLKEIMILSVTWLEHVVRVVKSHKEN